MHLIHCYFICILFALLLFGLDFWLGWYVGYNDCLGRPPHFTPARIEQWQPVPDFRSDAEHGLFAKGNSQRNKGSFVKGGG